jgi:hypothetical protein
MPWNKRLTAVWFLASLALTVGLTLVLWYVFGVVGFVGLLFLPFLWSGFRLFGGGEPPQERESWYKGQAPGRGTCPLCGWQAMDPRDGYCPRDGERLR